MRTLAAVMFVGGALCAADRVEIATPSVTGPIKWTAKAPDPSHGYTFNPTYLDLASKGYIEEEFFIEGTAHQYNMQTDATGSVKDDGHPYKTCIVVRRPVSAQKFNGGAILEW